MKKIILYAILFGTFLYSCGEDSSIEGGKSQITVRLTDSPADYDAVYIDVEKVELYTDDGWIPLKMENPGVYNLLELQNGVDMLLGNVTLPEGHISQIRMILGNDNSIVVNGTTHPLSTPSAMQSGLKINYNQILTASGSYTVWIDFDAARSIVEQGTGDYALKPVLRAFTETSNGRLKGYVLPQAADPVVHVISSSNDTIATAIPETDGYYMIMGLPQASYTVSFDAKDGTGYIDENQTGVNVSYGQITDLGSKTLVQ